MNMLIFRIHHIMCLIHASCVKYILICSQSVNYEQIMHKPSFPYWYNLVNIHISKMNLRGSMNTLSKLSTFKQLITPFAATIIHCHCYSMIKMILYLNRSRIMKRRNVSNSAGYMSDSFFPKVAWHSVQVYYIKLWHFSESIFIAGPKYNPMWHNWNLG